MALLDKFNKLATVDRRLRELAAQIATRVTQVMGPDYHVQITFGVRSLAEQDALFWQGRDTLEVVNGKRKTAGLQPITAAQNRGTVTFARAGKSPHNYGAAIDLVGIKNRQALWESKPIWDIVGEVVLANPEFTWGGDWNRNGRSDDEKFLDRPHVELTAWRDIAAGKAGIIP
jgi:hypothetical protein